MPQPFARSPRTALAALAAAALLASQALGVIQFDSATRLTTAPAAGPLLDAWNLQGEYANFLGTPIAPNLFIAARHIDGPTFDHLSGRTFTYGGVPYQTIDSFNIPNTDLRVHQIATNSFTQYATLYDANANGSEVGKSLIAVGRGTPRGGQFFAGAGNTDPRGWLWGSDDATKSYGTNAVDGIANFDSQSTTDTDFGDLVRFDFAGAGDISLTRGDSSGGLFVIVNGQAQLAGINLGVDGPFSTTASGPYQFASIYDARGLYVGDPANHELIPAGLPDAVAGSSYSSRISSNRAAINQIFLATGNAALVPEPATIAALAAGALFAARRNRRR